MMRRPLVSTLMMKAPMIVPRIVPDPPLARSLHGSVEVGHQIPEELFAAVAQILAYVYRVAGRRRLGAA